MTFSPDLNGLLSLGKKEKVMFVSVEAGDRCGEKKNTSKIRNRPEDEEKSVPFRLRTFSAN